DIITATIDLDRRTGRAGEPSKEILLSYLKRSCSSCLDSIRCSRLARVVRRTSVRTMTHRVAVPLARQQLSRNQGRADCYARSRCPSLTSLSVSTTAPTFEANRAGATSRSVTNLTFALMESDTPQLSI